jgi:DNA-binding NtrC family response regulator
MRELSLHQVKALVETVSHSGMDLAQPVRDGFSSAMKAVVRSVNECIGFINRHDEFYDSHGDADFSPLPPIWISGEEGVGKGVLVRRLLDGCTFRDDLFELDCRKPDPVRLTELLFGGASDAVHEEGYFWMADGNILVIREPRNLPEPALDKLWDWQRSGTMQRTGTSGKSEPVDMVLILVTEDASTHRELFSRTGVSPRLSLLRFIDVPPLRERPEDIALHLEYYLQAMGARLRGTEFSLSTNFDDTALSILINHPWPDNLSSLRAAVEFMVVSDILKYPHDRAIADQVRIALKSGVGFPDANAIDQVEELIWPSGRASGRSRYPGKEAMENFDQHTLQQEMSQLEAARALGIDDATLCRWRQKAGLPALPRGRRPKNRFSLP